MPDPLAPTVDHAPPGTTAALSRLVTAAPSAFGFNEELRVLLRHRLIIVHLAVCVGLCLGVALSSLAPAEGPVADILRAGDTWVGLLPPVQAVVGSVVLLARPGMSLRALRAWEVLHFFTNAAYFGAWKVELLASPPGGVQPPELAVIFAAVVSDLAFMTMIPAYGVLVPNTRRRSVAMVAGLAAIPLAAVLVAGAVNPDLGAHLPLLVVLTAELLAAPVAVAVFGATKAATLRREAFEARRAAERVGPYTLTRKLGEGGMGEVWLAEHRLLKRPCAVKFVRPEFAANPSAAARFEREVRAVTALSHPNTVRVYDYGRADDGGFYYVMEYLPGPTLVELVEWLGPVPPGRAVYLGRQVCGALAEAHAAGLVHRDIKPGNILVTALGGQYDVAKLLDFGLVHDLAAAPDDGRLTRTGAVLGTPAYMSPEQAGGEAVDARGDLYSLGAVLFFAVAGRPPFDAPAVGKLLAAHLTEAPPRLTDLRPDLPADLADVVARCLAKDPAGRFATAAELDAALAGCGCAADWSAARAAEWWAAAGALTLTQAAP